MMQQTSTFLKNLTLVCFTLLLPFSGAMATEVTSTAASSPAPAGYPLTICVVSGDKLGAMGPAVVENYQGTEVQFCCKDCVKDFQKDPEKYMNRLHEAEAKQKANSGS